MSVLKTISIFLLLPLFFSRQVSSAETEEGKFLRVARTGSPVVRPQAARKLASFGEAATKEVRSYLAEHGGNVASLGPDVVGVLGRLPGDDIRELLWQSVNDPSFPWRPAAARSLAETARPDEFKTVSGFLNDSLAAVRLSGLTALEVSQQQSIQAVRARLEDQDDRVRRGAARLLDLWGRRWALAWPLEELKREDRYFESETGKKARFAAFGLLKKNLGGKWLYRPDRSPTTPENVEAIKAIRADWSKLLTRPAPRLPNVAKAGSRIENEVLGLEIRSCRKGEFFLRWTEDDALHLGTGNPIRVQLAEGTVKLLRRDLPGILSSVGDQRLWGDPGCDMEVYRWVRNPSEIVTFVLSKGAEKQEDLRPEALERLTSRLLLTIPAGTGDPARNSYERELIRSALSSVGGPVK